MSRTTGPSGALRPGGRAGDDDLHPQRPQGGVGDVVAEPEVGGEVDLADGERPHAGGRGDGGDLR